MAPPLPLRERKKRETRHRLGDVAARLFAQYGYDAVSVNDVARAADVSEQTVFNYFPTKPDLVLDRADEILERSHGVVADRAPGETPADVLRVLVHEDIDRYRHADLAQARGEFPALCLNSPALRRCALEFRDHQAAALAAAIVETSPAVHPLVARAHAGALVTLIQVVSDRIGAAITDGDDPDQVAAAMRADADIAFADAAANFRASTTRATRTAGEHP